jgi:hypothetical protein
MKSHLARRGQRSWRLKYDLGTDGAGKRQTRYVTLRGTRAEAQAQAAKILATVAEGTHSRVGSRRGSGFDDADVSSIPPIIPYGGFSPIRLQG